MTKSEIEKEYVIDEHGIIISPGKFQREMYYAVHYWECTLNGASDDIEEDGDNEGNDIYIFNLKKEDINQFPELEGNTILKIWEDTNGFVFCEVY